jgi:gas vesicle protein
VNVAIAVGLITSGSTLIGGAIASITALMVQRNQLGKEASRALSEREELRNSQLRALRREVYVQMLARFDEADDALLEHWKDDAGGNPDEPVSAGSDASEKAVRNFDHIINLVRLEGAEEVVKAAEEASGVLWGEFRYMTELIVKYPGPKEILHQAAGDKYGDFYSARRVMKEKLARVSRSTLNENYNSISQVF